MADPSKCPPLTRESVQRAHQLIRRHIHLTPVLTSTTLSTLASTPQSPEALLGTEYEGQEPARPKINLFFKCENYQKVGAFKARGAFHALARLSDEELSRGVVTHSSGNHAQALALAARTRNVPAYIVMPTISTPSKIAATKAYGAEVTFSGSTSDEREAAVAAVIARTGARLVPPYDHPDIVLGQGTLALEFERQVQECVGRAELGVRVLDHADRVGGVGVEDGRGAGAAGRRGHGQEGEEEEEEEEGEGPKRAKRGLHAVVAPCGGGGMLAGVATALAGTGVRVFGAEPSFQGADDARRGLAAGRRVERVRSLTVADGLRTPVGRVPWGVISDAGKVQAVHAVSERQIAAAMRLLLERAKVVVEPSAAVGLAVCLFDEGFRRRVQREAGPAGWNVGVVLSGGNTTVEAIASLFQAPGDEGERAEGVLGARGERVAENVAG